MKTSSLVLAVAALMPQAASAGLMLIVENQSHQFSPDAQTGSFEVYVTSDLAPQPNLVGYQLRLQSATPGIVFTSYERTTTHTPYLLEGGQMPSGSVGSGGHQLDVGDMFFVGTRQLVDGAGVVKVNYQVAPGTAAGSYAFAVDTGISWIKKDDGASGAAIPYTVTGGTITVVPEPAAIALLACALGALIVGIRQRRKHACSRVSA